MLGAERFLTEIRITARLDHPHILPLIDSGSVDGFLYYVLPYVHGESLRALLDREGRLGFADALAIARQVASALDYAHRQGVIHRDVKPENILLREGEAMLMDFGIALAMREAGGTRLTEAGLSLGTPQYMSPEQATGDRHLDGRTDEYSLAAVFYEMLSDDSGHLISYLGWGPSLEDSVNLGAISLDNGSNTRWATVFAENAGTAFLSDGSILFVVFKTAQTAAVYRLRGPGRMELLGTIPRPVSDVSTASDLDRALVTVRDYHADAWMVRILPR